MMSGGWGGGKVIQRARVDESLGLEYQGEDAVDKVESYDPRVGKEKWLERREIRNRGLYR